MIPSGRSETSVWTRCPRSSFGAPQHALAAQLPLFSDPPGKRRTRTDRDTQAIVMKQSEKDLGTGACLLKSRREPPETGGRTSTSEGVLVETPPRPQDTDSSSEGRLNRSDRQPVSGLQARAYEAVVFFADTILKFDRSRRYRRLTTSARTSGPISSSILVHTIWDPSRNIPTGIARRPPAAESVPRCAASFRRSQL